MATSDKPKLLVSSDEVPSGSSVNFSCIVPGVYLGGACRLFRENSHNPFLLMTATQYVCVFKLRSEDLLGGRPVGSRVLLWCDYQLQQWRSERSDLTGVTVWGTSPSPGLAVTRRVVSLDDGVEVSCSPPAGSSASSCQFYRDRYRVTRGTCTRNLTGRDLVVWKSPALLVPVNLTCRYRPPGDPDLDLRSGSSNHVLLSVIDESMVCDVDQDQDQDQLAALGPEGQWIRDLMVNKTCTQT